MSRDGFGCHGSAVPGIQWIEARGASKRPSTHRTAPWSQRTIRSKVSSPEVALQKGTFCRPEHDRLWEAGFPCKAPPELV